MQHRRYGKPFQFFNYMVDIPGFLDTVSRAWSLPCTGSPISQFLTRIKHTKQALRDLNKANGNVLSNVQLARANLDEAQAALAREPHLIFWP